MDVGTWADAMFPPSTRSFTFFFFRRSAGSGGFLGWEERGGALLGRRARIRNHTLDAFSHPYLHLAFAPTIRRGLPTTLSALLASSAPCTTVFICCHDLTDRPSSPSCRARPSHPSLDLPSHSYVAMDAASPPPPQSAFVRPGADVLDPTPPPHPRRWRFLKEPQGGRDGGSGEERRGRREVGRWTPLIRATWCDGREAFR